MVARLQTQLAGLIQQAACISDFANPMNGGMPAWRQGYCDTTAWSAGNSAAGGSGSYELLGAERRNWRAAVQACEQHCHCCASCRYTSLSLKHGDCSWFSNCDLSRLKGSAGQAGDFRTFAVDRRRRGACSESVDGWCERFLCEKHVRTALRGCESRGAACEQHRLMRLAAQVDPAAATSAASEGAHLFALATGDSTFVTQAARLVRSVVLITRRASGLAANLWECGSSQLRRALLLVSICRN